MKSLRLTSFRWLSALATLGVLAANAPFAFAEEKPLTLLSVEAEERLHSDLEPDTDELIGVNYVDPDFADVPPSPSTDNLVRDLTKRLSEIEKQLKKRDDADKKTADTAAKKFVVRPFGRVHMDAANIRQDADNKATVGDAQSGVDFRRARFGFEGEGFDTFFYRFDVDFASLDSNSNNTQSTNRRPVIVDAYLDTQNLPVIGNLRVGRFREPFVERSIATSALVPFRNMGIMAFDCNEAETRTWSYGIFQENSNAFGEAFPSKGGLAVTGRTTWLPWYDELAEGRYLLHVGASYSYRLVSNRLTRFGTTPEITLKQDTPLTLFQTPRFVNTPVINMLDYHVMGVEATTMLGSLAIEGEYMFVSGNQINNPNLFFHGGYIEAMYYLTGEHRNYNRKLGIHGPLQIHNNFFRVDTDKGVQTSWGAWEATARVSTLNLNSQNINGGRLTDLTLGMNWYYTTRSRIMFNYIHAFLDAKGANTQVTNSNADIFAVRYQWAF
jgi:phosphate-selective porin OprO/OprP